MKTQSLLHRHYLSPAEEITMANRTKATTLQRKTIITITKTRRAVTIEIARIMDLTQRRTM
jgi:hypothetical protein